jgi:leucyl/phenylalanyl-tRNA--protein transferase
MDDENEFPPLHTATDFGLLAVGGRLTAGRVLRAYRRGIFPWPIVEPGLEVLAWFTPDPRAIIELEALHISRRLARRLRTGQFRITCDRCFAEVMAGCAAPRDDDDSGTWITSDMVRVYCELHQQGHAHSVEVWAEERLVGGIYGIGLGGFFAGESMFHRVRDASKVALVALVAHLRARGYALFDIQQATPHAVSIGATEIRRSRFLARLRSAIALPASFGSSLDLSLLPDMLRRE